MKAFNMKTFDFERWSISLYQVWNRFMFKISICHDYDDEDNLVFALTILFWGIEIGINTRSNERAARWWINLPETSDNNKNKVYYANKYFGTYNHKLLIRKEIRKIYDKEHIR